MVQSEAFNFNNDSRVEANRDKFKASVGGKKNRKNREYEGTINSKSSKHRKSKTRKAGEDSRD